MYIENLSKILPLMQIKKNQLTWVFMWRCLMKNII